MKKTPTKVLMFTLCLMLALLPTVNIAKASSASSYAWATFQGNAQRTGYTESPAPESNQTCWKFQTGGPILSSPVVAEGIVFVASTDGYLYAVNITTGTKMWNFFVGADVNSPTVDNGKVFFASSSGTVYSVDMYTGTEAWSYPIGEPAGFGSPLFVGSRMLVNGNHTVFVFNGGAGVFLYSNPLAHVDYISPLSSDGFMVYAVTFRNEYLGGVGFELLDGNHRFSMYYATRSAENVKNGATVSDEHIFVVAPNIENQSCTVSALSDIWIPTWEAPLDGVTEASAAFAYDTVYVPTSTCAYALDPENGTIKWSTPINGENSVSSPAVADGKVYFGLDNSYIYALDAFTGDIVWSYKTEGAVQSSPAISDGLLFVGSTDGNLYAIGTPVIPEFSSLAPIIFAVTLVVCVAATYKRKMCTNTHGGAVL